MWHLLSANRGAGKTEFHPRIIFFTGPNFCVGDLLGDVALGAMESAEDWFSRKTFSHDRKPEEFEEIKGPSTRAEPV